MAKKISKEQVLGAALAASLALSACPQTVGGGNSTGGKPSNNGGCKCAAGTEHMYDIKCCEGSDCKCRTYYGEVTGLTNAGNTVRVYKEAGATITDAQMLDAVAKLQSGYDGNSSYHSAMNDKITEIHIIDSGNYYYDNSKVFGVHYSKADSYVGSILVDISDGSTIPGSSAMLKQAGDAIKMANVKAPSKLFVAFERANNRRARSIVNNSRMNVMRG